MPTPALPWQLVGLVDPASRSWIAPGLQAAKWLEDKRYALQQVLSALGEQNLPDLMTHVLQSRCSTAGARHAGHKRVGLIARSWRCAHILRTSSIQRYSNYE
eukprot:scaffold36288_cov110-Isochrysis_galbana.AAC.1